MSTINDLRATTRTLHATCHCRASTLSFTVPTASFPLPVHFCHCGICRHATGSFFTAGTLIPEPTVNLSSFTAYKSSKPLTRWFCSTCGANLMASVEVGDVTKWCVSAPSVDAEEDIWKFADHLHVRDTGDGGLAALLTKVDGTEIGLWNELHVGDEPDWQPHQRKSDTIEDKVQLKELLHARCHCGGVSFSISRPTGNETFTEIDENNVRKDKTKWLGIHDVCNSCRVTISTFVISWLFPSRDHITLSDGAPYPADGMFGTTKLYKSSGEVERTFCSTCGATVSYVTAERPHVVDIAAGLLVVENARAEDWVEWRTYKLAFEEDAIWKSVRDALKSSLQMCE